MKDSLNLGEEELQLGGRGRLEVRAHHLAGHQEDADARDEREDG